MTSTALENHLEGLIRMPIPKNMVSLDVDEDYLKLFSKPFIFNIKLLFNFKLKNNV